MLIAIFILFILALTTIFKQCIKHYPDEKKENKKDKGR